MRLAPLLLLPLACAEDATTSPAERLFPLDAATRYPEVRNCRATTDHGFGDMRVRVFINPEAKDAYTNGVYPFPEGTTVVKAIYEDPGDGSCTTVSSYSVMKKGAPGSAPDVGDWAWQETDAEGNILTSRAVGVCTSCHASCTDGRDWTCTDP